MAPGETSRDKGPLNRALFDAAAAGEDATVARLLAAGADPNARFEAGRTALLAACDSLSAAGDGELLTGADGGSNTAVAATGSVVARLVQAGAAIGAKDDTGACALHLLATTPGPATPALIRFFAKRGVPVDSPDAAGRTPLMLAAGAGNVEAAAALVALGAAGAASNATGRTSLHHAAEGAAAAAVAAGPSPAGMTAGLPAAAGRLSSAGSGSSMSISMSLPFAAAGELLEPAMLEASQLQTLLARAGGDAAARDARGRTPLEAAAAAANAAYVWAALGSGSSSSPEAAAVTDRSADRRSATAAAASAAQQLPPVVPSGLVVAMAAGLDAARAAFAAKEEECAALRASLASLGSDVEAALANVPPASASGLDLNGDSPDAAAGAPTPRRGSFTPGTVSPRGGAAVGAAASTAAAGARVARRSLSPRSGGGGGGGAAATTAKGAPGLASGGSSSGPRGLLAAAAQLSGSLAEARRRAKDRQTATAQARAAEIDARLREVERRRQELEAQWAQRDNEYGLK